ncbi:o-succinylbenzoate--CoA ligase [Rossellomorea marisflavi]|uniref:o-succinylbenzoate--CoA ligase n=1 Tax=Rossellomorea marisflavi TaxID=189381 RepID=UPI003D2EE9A3
MEGISYWIGKWAYLRGEKTAIITDQESITYKELNERINRAAGKLQQELKVGTGERVAILSQNRMEYIILLFATAKIGAVAVPLNIRLSASELVFQLMDSGTKVIAADEEHVPLAKGLLRDTKAETILPLDELLDGPLLSLHEEKNVSAPFIICYTSGTTGKPKGAVLTQENMFWNAVNNTLAVELTSDDRSVVLLPLFHIGGIGLFALPTLFAGGTIVIPGKFDPEKTLEMIEEHRVTIVMGVPTIHQALLHSPSFDGTDLSSVRWFYNGGAPCPHELITAFIERGFLFGQGFGMTETSPTVFMLMKEDARRKIGSIGKPVMFNDFKLMGADGQTCRPGEVGELTVRGANVMKEYWNRPDATKETIVDGWLHTGDLARVDEEGFVYIVGRKKEMIISGGENIYPLEVEQVINQIEDVEEVAVVGAADPRWGEVPVAFIVKKKGSSLSEEEVLGHCTSQLARYKLPKVITFLEELPKNATGKIQKTQLVRSGS